MNHLQNKLTRHLYNPLFTFCDNINISLITKYEIADGIIFEPLKKLKLYYHYFFTAVIILV